MKKEISAAYCAEQIVRYKLSNTIKWLDHHTFSLENHTTVTIIRGEILISRWADFEFSNIDEYDMLRFMEFLNEINNAPLLFNYCVAAFSYEASALHIYKRLPFPDTLDLDTFMLQLEEAIINVAQIMIKLKIEVHNASLPELDDTDMEESSPTESNPDEKCFTNREEI